MKRTVTVLMDALTLVEKGNIIEYYRKLIISMVEELFG